MGGRPDYYVTTSDGIFETFISYTGNLQYIGSSDDNWFVDWTEVVDNYRTGWNRDCPSTMPGIFTCSPYGFAAGSRECGSPHSFDQQQWNLFLYWL